MGNIITVGEGEYVGLDNVVLQRAVDAVATAGGGEVKVKAGEYLMRDSLHLRSKVVVSGDGGVVLRKAGSVKGKLKHVVGYGHYEFAVEDCEGGGGSGGGGGFEVGMGVHLTDDNAGGFYDTVASIVGRDGDWFYIDRQANHDYSSKSGVVRSVFPLISICGAQDVGVENLKLVGDESETFSINGCRGAGVYMLGSQRVYIEGVEVKGFNGDGVSFQQCADVAVSGCKLHGNMGQGLHPGSGSVRYVMEGNEIYENGLHGIFYCLRTTHSICRGNKVWGNKDMGITIGERDTDHLIADNVVEGNGGCGIEFREPWTSGGDRVVIRGNVIKGNCQTRGDAEIFVAGGVCDVQVGENRIFAGEGKAMAAGQGCLRVSFFGNEVNGEKQVEGDVVGGGAVEFERKGDWMAVGPGELGDSGDVGLGHLGIRGNE